MDHVLLCVLDFLILSFLCCGNSQEATESVLTVSPSWLNPGASVTLSCEVKDSSAGWRFYWYKVVPDLPQKNYRYELLPGNISGTVENSFIVTGQKHTAGFACRAGRGSPEIFTDYSGPKFIWSADPHPAASLSVSPDREQHFISESVTLNCAGNSTEWRVKEFRENYDKWREMGFEDYSYGLSFWDEDDEITSEHQMSDCSNSWKMTGSSCTINIHWSRIAVYWCESVSGEFSNAVNISINEAPDSVLTVSPSWLSPGASVTLSCEVKDSSAGWRFYWYKAVPDLSLNIYRYELLPGSFNGTVENSFIITGQKHTAGFACRAGRGNSEYLTDYSEPTFVWTTDPHPAASLSVSPDREQHFTSESVTLNCGGNSTEWRVMVTSELSFSSYTDSCSTWGAMNGSLCTFSSPQYSKATFWCESESGELSNAVNLTVQDEDLLLVSPVHPVTEGASVTLSCITREQNKLSNVTFYHNNKLRQNDDRGELNISAVSQSDEGFYKCEHSGKVSSQSWMAVEAVLKQSSSSFPVMWAVGPVCGIVLVVLLLLLIRFIRFKGTSYFYDLVRPTKEPENDPKKGQSISYSLLNFKNTGNMRCYLEPDDSPVNYDLRVGAAGRSSSAAANAAVYSEVKSDSGY